MEGTECGLPVLLCLLLVPVVAFQDGSDCSVAAAQQLVADVVKRGLPKAEPAQPFEAAVQGIFMRRHVVLFRASRRLASSQARKYLDDSTLKKVKQRIVIIFCAEAGSKCQHIHSRYE